ncbi:MAG: MBL fold metallo-hydrolase [Gemmatimonadetes bacterium]|nr:MBL fold metallo-hydrolase [Gemmatimonadota bacterium]
MQLSANLRGAIATHVLALAPAFALAILPTAARAQPSARTQVVMLGTGTPIPDPDRYGQAIAIVVDSVAYLFDAGVGVVRRASAAGLRGVRAFSPPSPQAQPDPRFEAMFITHLHSDHTMGLAEAIFTPWIQGRRAPIDIFGPPGLSWLVSTILDGNAEDIQERTAAPGGPSREGWQAVVHEVNPGEVFKDSRLTVRAFRVLHSEWPNAYGYRIDTPDRSIVISGDTRESDAVAEACNGCDVLIHEVYSDSGFKTIPAGRQAYHASAHTAATAVGRVATKGRAKMVILTHVLAFGSSEEILLREVRSTFAGRVVAAKDLDIY